MEKEIRQIIERFAYAVGGPSPTIKAGDAPAAIAILFGQKPNMEWLPIPEKELDNRSDYLLLFDNGQICRYNEAEWPRAILTHYIVIPNPPKNG